MWLAMLRFWLKLRIFNSKSLSLNHCNLGSERYTNDIFHKWLNNLYLQLIFTFNDYLYNKTFSYIVLLTSPFLKTNTVSFGGVFINRIDKYPIYNCISNPRKLFILIIIKYCEVFQILQSLPQIKGKIPVQNFWHLNTANNLSLGKFTFKKQPRSLNHSSVTILLSAAYC